MAQNDIKYYLSRAAEEDRRAAASDAPVIVAVHRAFAQAYRERAVTIAAREKLVRFNLGGGKARRRASGSATQAPVKVVIVEPSNLRELGTVADRECASA